MVFYADKSTDKSRNWSKKSISNDHIDLFNNFEPVSKKIRLINKIPNFESQLSQQTLIIYAMLEEIGWRGFLQEHLSFINKYLKIIIVGLLWFIWHLNFAFTISNAVFLIILILGSWGIGYVADKTKSLMAVGSFHVLHNFYTTFHSSEKIIVIFLCATIWILYIIFHSKWMKKECVVAEKEAENGLRIG